MYGTESIAEFLAVVTEARSSIQITGVVVKGVGLVVCVYDFRARGVSFEAMLSVCIF